MSYIVLVIAVMVATGFVYSFGYLEGSQTEKDKQNEKELETLKTAVAARNNAQLDGLRSKYKRNSVRST